MRDNYKKNQKCKEFVIVAFACFVCLSAIFVGSTIVNKKGDKSEKDTSNIVDLNETTNGLENLTSEDKETYENMPVDGKVEKNTDNNKDIEETTSSQVEDNTESIIETKSNEVVDVAGKVANFNFGTDSSLAWPLSGNVMLEYNMDNTIYFPTLDSYKCNPAIVIAAEQGTNVLAGVRGCVEEVSYNDEIGNYVVLNLGNDYKLTIGQLENIGVSVGETVESDTSIGVVAMPTRYYSLEGSNLYYMLTKSGEPCDPLDFLT